LGFLLIQIILTVDEYLCFCQLSGVHLHSVEQLSVE
jgi:hypothetical protein